MPYDEYLKSKSKLNVYTYFWDTLYFVVKEISCKKTGLTNHNFWKHLLNGFKL